MYAIRIELHVNKFIFFLTDNYRVAELIRSKEFVYVTSHSDEIEATMIDFDLRRYRRSVNIEEWIQVLDEYHLGAFILAYGYMKKNTFTKCAVYSNGLISEKKRVMFMQWLNTLPMASEDENGQLIKIKIGNSNFLISPFQHNNGGNNVPDFSEMHMETAVTRPEILEVTPQKPQWDSIIEEAVAIIIEKGQASVSSLQRRMRIGYTRAARLIDTLEELGIVGPYEGSKPREVLYRNVPDLQALLTEYEVKKSHEPL